MMSHNRKGARRLTAGGPDSIAGEVVTVYQLPSLRSYAVKASLLDYAFPRHSHDEYHITVLLHGAQASTVGRNLHEIQHEGEIKFAEPGEVHDGTPTGHGVRSYWTLYLEQGTFAEVTEDSAVLKSQFDWRPKMFRDHGLFQRLSCMFSSMADGSSILAVETRIFRAVAEIGLISVDRSLRQSSSLPAALSYAKQMIDDDPSASLRLGDLASAAGLTKHQIVHGFQRLVGIPPHSYQIQRRVGLAIKLIGTGRLLADVAIEAGFSDQAHMTRTFRAMLGVTPGAFAPGRRVAGASEARLLSSTAG